MEEKINVEELLKDCPRGMELDCTIYKNVVFDGIKEGHSYPVLIKSTQDGAFMHLNKYGCLTNEKSAKCVIFPKGKNSWENFQRPFKDGDIVFYNNTITIFKEWGDKTLFRTYCALYTTVSDPIYQFEICRPFFGKFIRKEARFATEEEKQKLFQAIKDNGYKWYSETKTLEKLIEPKFKVGDIIRHKRETRLVCTIARVEDRYYVHGHPTCFTLLFSSQDEYELVPDKFDITTLKTFDKVLVKTKNFTPVWTIDFYDGYRPNVGGSFTPFGVSGGKYFQQCIPYEGNEHLLGTTDDCDEFYKTWE